MNGGLEMKVMRALSIVCCCMLTLSATRAENDSNSTPGESPSLSWVKKYRAYPEALRAIIRDTPDGRSIQEVFGSELERFDLVLEVLWNLFSQGTAGEKKWAADALLTIVKGDFDLSLVKKATRTQIPAEIDEFLLRKYCAAISEREAIGAAILLRQRDSEVAQRIVREAKIPDLKSLAEQAERLNIKK